MWTVCKSCMLSRWSMLRKLQSTIASISSYKNERKTCKLCLTEKMHIAHLHWMSFWLYIFETLYFNNLEFSQFRTIEQGANSPFFFIVIFRISATMYTSTLANLFLINFFMFHLKTYPSSFKSYLHHLPWVKRLINEYYIDIVIMLMCNWVLCAWMCTLYRQGLWGSVWPATVSKIFSLPPFWATIYVALFV